MQRTTRPTFLTSSKKDLFFLAGILILLIAGLTMPFIEDFTFGKYNASSVPSGFPGYYKTMFPGYHASYAWVQVVLIFGMAVAGNTGRKPANFILFGICIVLFLFWYFLLHKLTTTPLDPSRPVGVYVIAAVGFLSVVQAGMVLFRRAR